MGHINRWQIKKKKLIWDVLNISNTDCNGWVRKKNFCFDHTDSRLITYKRKMIGWKWHDGSRKNRTKELQPGGFDTK